MLETKIPFFILFLESVCLMSFSNNLALLKPIYFNNCDFPDSSLESVDFFLDILHIRNGGGKRKTSRMTMTVASLCGGLDNKPNNDSSRTIRKRTLTFSRVDIIVGIIKNNLLAKRSISCCFNKTFILITIYNLFVCEKFNHQECVDDCSRIFII